MIPSKDYKAFLKGKLELPVSQCELRQRGVDNPQVYEGPGLIGQDSNEGLELRLFVTQHSDDAMMRHMKDSFSTKVGELVPDDRYYDFRCTDASGNVWTAQALDPDMSFATAVFAKAKIRYLDYKAEPKPKRRYSVVRAEIKGDFDLPWHAVTRSEAKTEVDVFESEGEDYSWRIRKSDWGMTVEEFKVHNGSAQPSFRRFLIALGIACGKSVVSVLTQTYDAGGEFSTELHSPRRPRWKAKILKPIPHHRHEAAASNDFILAFLRNVERFEEDRTDAIYALWHRVLRAGENDVANSSLVLTVAIESLLEKSFHTKHDEDLEFLNEVSHAKDLLDGVGFMPRAASRIRASLDGAGQVRPIDTLWRLNEQGLVDKVHINAWKKLRNAVAHGDDIDGHEQLQGTIDLYHQCLGLFYRLIFILVDYKGDFVDYSARSWPTRRMVSTTGAAQQETPDSD